MKSSSILLLLLPLLLFTFTIKSSPVLADNAPEAVRDTSGNEVRSGLEYYILPVTRGRSGGLTLAPNRNGSCPFDVVQDQNKASNGHPLTFTPVDPKKGIIRVTTDLNIKFSAATKCPQSTVWQLADFDESIRQSLVTTGGVEGNPGCSTLSNWFKIEKYEDAYKLVFCPSVCDTTFQVLCTDIGIYTDNGVRRLALSDKPFMVMFKKV